MPVSKSPRRLRCLPSKSLIEFESNLNCFFFLCLAYPKGKKYNGPLNTKKKKSFKQKHTDSKKTLQAKQEEQKCTANKNGPKAQSLKGSSTQASEGESNTRVFVSTC